MHQIEDNINSSMLPRWLMNTWTVELLKQNRVKTYGRIILICNNSHFHIQTYIDGAAVSEHTTSKEFLSYRSTKRWQGYFLSCEFYRINMYVLLFRLFHNMKIYFLYIELWKEGRLFSNSISEHSFKLPYSHQKHTSQN